MTNETTIGISFPMTLELHRRLKVEASMQGTSMKKFIVQLLEENVPVLPERKT